MYAWFRWVLVVVSVSRGVHLMYTQVFAHSETP